MKRSARSNDLEQNFPKMTSERGAWRPVPAKGVDRLERKCAEASVRAPVKGPRWEQRLEWSAMFKGVLNRSLVSRALSVLVALVGIGAASHGLAQVQNGPNPTTSLLEASSGPYSISSDSVSSFVFGFGGGTIYYPNQSGSYGVVAICPGFTAGGSTVAWLGRRIASHGFVTIVIDTNSIFDYPSSRASQLEAALEYVVEDASYSVRSRVDENRLAVAGHSMGGGGTLIAARNDSSLRAAYPMTPWNLESYFQGVSVPSMIIGAQLDTIASVSSHSIPFYNALSSSLDKAYAELRGASHFAPNTTNTMIGKYAVAWFKRFLDGDTRYSPFLCGTPNAVDRAGISFSDYRETCPY